MSAELLVSSAGRRQQLNGDPDRQARAARS